MKLLRPLVVGLALLVCYALPAQATTIEITKADYLIQVSSAVDDLQLYNPEPVQVLPGQEAIAVSGIEPPGQLIKTHKVNLGQSLYFAGIAAGHLQPAHYWRC